MGDILDMDNILTEDQAVSLFADEDTNEIQESSTPEENKEEQQDEFTDDRINSFNNNSNQFNGYSGMSSDGNIVQFPMNNSNNDINKPFAA